MPGYLETIRSVKSRWKVLVVDERAHELLTSVLTTYDILEEGVQRESPRTARLEHLALIL